MTQPDDLRSLLEAATPGPWVAEAIGSEGYVVYAPPLPAGTRRRPRVAACTYEAWETDKANAAAFAAVMNLAPQLLTLWEAARELQSVMHPPFTTSDHPCACWTHEKFRNALAALEAKP